MGLEQEYHAQTYTKREKLLDIMKGFGKPVEGYMLVPKEEALKVKDDHCFICKEYEAIINSPLFTKQMGVIVFNWHIVGVM